MEQPDIPNWDMETVQNIKIRLTPHDPIVLNIDDMPIKNVRGIKIESEGDNVDVCVVTFKVAIRSDSLIFEADQRPPNLLL